MVSDQQRREWDAKAADLGPTLRYDKRGELIPFDDPEDPEEKRTGTYYVVWHGRAVGIFRNWGLTDILVCGYSGCAHKSFVGLETARVAWENGPRRKNQNWTPPGKPRPAQSTSSQSPIPPAEESDDEDDSSPDRHPDIASCTPRVEVPIRPEDYKQLGLELEARAAEVQDDTHSASPPRARPSRSSGEPVSTPSNPPWMSSGTLSPRTVHTPDIIPAITSLALGERLSDMYGGGSSSEMRACTSTSDPVNPLNPETKPSDTKFRFDTERAAARSEGEPVFVVLRGEHPGVYFDKDTALLAAGCIPAAKIVPFTSLSTACVYFVQKYMAGNVGGAGLRADE